MKTPEEKLAAIAALRRYKLIGYPGTLVPAETGEWLNHLEVIEIIEDTP